MGICATGSRREDAREIWSPVVRRLAGDDKTMTGDTAALPLQKMLRMTACLLIHLGHPTLCLGVKARRVICSLP